MSKAEAGILKGQQQVTLDDSEMLCFKVGKGHYAVTVAEIHEIMHLSSIAAVPNTKQAILGLSLVRGDVVTVIDLKYYLDKQPTNTAEDCMVLLSGVEGSSVALCVDEVLGIRRVDSKDMMQAGTLTTQSYLTANINIDGTIFMALNLGDIIRDIRA